MLTFLVLGNPGAEYENTRHNAGRVVFNALFSHWGLPGLVSSAKYGGLMSEGVISDQEIRILYPSTYMNNSGEVAAKVVEADVSRELVVVYDDVDIPLGEAKLSFGRGAGGHNGLSSVIDRVGSKEFWRIRIGIAPKSLFGKTVRPNGDKLQRYVMGQLSKREQEKLQNTKDEILTMVEQVLKEVSDK